MLLLRDSSICCKVLHKIGYRITFYLKVCRCLRESRCCLGIYTGCMINEVCVKSRFLYLINGKISCELIQYCTNHFKVRKFLCTYLVKSQVPKSKNVVISGLSGYSAKCRYLKFKEFGQIQNAHAM